VKLWCKLITIAEFLFEMNNFHTLMAILSGMNETAVFRLKKTKSEIPQRYIESWQRMEKFMSGEQNYKTYREALDAIPHSHAHIPYLYVSPLSFCFCAIC
jgi:hypothetical protein